MPGIFNKLDQKPVTEYGDAFTDGHGGFDLDLDDLINNQNQNDQRIRP